MNFNLLMQVFVALGLGIKRNWHIFTGIILGIIFGILMHTFETPYNNHILQCLIFVGQVFIRLIQMVVIPLVVSAIIIGVTSIGDNRQLGKFGKKMIIYYGIITTFAVTIGAVLALIFKPGVGAAAYITENAALSAQELVKNAMAQQGNILNLILDFIPRNPFTAFATGNMVSIIVFVLLFAVALAKVGDINRPIVSFFESVFAATMKVTDWIMILAAPGVFALTASVVASFGLDIFASISKYLLVLLLGFALMLFVVYPIFLKVFSKVSAAMLYSAVAEALMVAFGTASSSATLPLTIACCEKRGISHKIARTQAYGIELTPLLIIQIALLAIIASSTCAGIPGAGLITIALILNGMGLSPEQLVAGFAFLFTIERVTDMMRTLVNVASDTVVVATIADNENEINYDLLNNPQAYEKIS